MGILKIVADYILPPPDPRDVYCQNCGDEVNDNKIDESVGRINFLVLMYKGVDMDAVLDDLKEAVDRIAEKVKALDVRIMTPGIHKWVSAPIPEATMWAIEAEKKLEDYLHAHPSLITVAGNIGLGKSTAAMSIAQSLRIEGLYEEPMENPLLAAFLTGDKEVQKSLCYKLQMHFLEMRSEHRLKGKSGNGSYIKDRSLAEDPLVFCKYFHADGTLTSEELDMLNVAFKSKSDALPPADLMLVLQGTPDFAWDRMQERARKMELEGGWPRSAIDAFGTSYNTYGRDVKNFGYHRGPIIEIDVQKLDILNRVHAGYIYDSMLKVLEENE